MTAEPCLVLVVDDDRDIRETLGEVLNEEGFRAVCVGDGRAALDQLESGLRPEVILLDLMMPRMDGWHFRLEQAKRPSLADIPVVVITAAGEPLPAPIDARKILSKPVQYAALLATVNEFC
ncbi:MAG: hypothetical protein NVSMB23_11070 [Myxococcales bacterium]